MTEPFFSSSWYRVKDLTPRLRAHTRVHRHVYRGEPWYVLQDASQTSFHRFTPTANLVIGLMDGRRSLDEVWRHACDELGDDAPTQDEVIRLLGQLHAGDVLQCDVPPDVAELFERWQRQERQRWTSRLLSPFAIKIPVLDPERFLARTLPWVRPVFSWAGFALWLAVVVPALALALAHWGELTNSLLDRLFTLRNLAMIWLIFPVIKVLHELGHGYAAKAFGGEVHDMGIMFLVFTPVPYVDASCSWSFASKYRRVLVGTGGMLAELFAAALAFYVWLGAEPGAVRAIAHNAIVIAGVSTLLFNANPLLRFDGYYILSDLLEIPNLRARANRYVLQLSERHLFGRRDTKLPETAPGEAAWFVLYAVGSFVYRIFIVVAILWWILGRFLVVGIVLGAVAGIGWFGIPLARAIHYLVAGPALRRQRGRVLALVGGTAAVVALLLVAVPFPLRTRAEGVVWVPEDALVRSGADGWVERTLARPGARVEAGELLVEIRDPVLGKDVRMLEARVRELQAVYRAQRKRDLAESEVTREALRYAQDDLARAQEKLAELEIRSRTAGTFVLPRADDLPGRFIRKGALIATVVDLETTSVRAVVPQDDIDLVRRRTREVEVRLAGSLSETHAARVRRIVPAASDRLPSVALGIVGGGEVPTDPSERGGDRAVQRLFEVELELPTPLPLVNTGGRVYVRFDHGSEPLGAQWYRRLRQLFLSRLRV